MGSVKPSYLRSYVEGQLSETISVLKSKCSPCTICPHRCKVNRHLDASGSCHSKYLPKVASVCPHFGEEPPLVGYYGSGTIFLSSCNLSCIFCQNYDISQMNSGVEVSISDLAHMMIRLQERGCHNINFVTPTHMIAPIVEALPEAIESGLSVPLVYNSGGYDDVNTLKMLEGIFDIYMPDLKYMDEKTGFELSGIPDYPEILCRAIHEMYRQVGDLQINEQGIAIRGLIIRHLILPDNLAGTDRAIEFIADMSANSYLNLMDQYRPEYNAFDDKRMTRRITSDEFSAAVDLARKHGLHRLAT
ncbi:radical SAM protein [Bacteroidota bacterium]